MKSLFILAQVSMVLHVVFGFLLRHKIDEAELRNTLFVVPNSWLGGRRWSMAAPMLKAKFFLPWVSSPHSLNELSLDVVVLFWLSRLAGAVFIVAMLSFFISAFLVML